jgi:hypothetical protein
MADEVAETFGGGLRAYLAAGGFIVMLIGAEILREGGNRWIGIGLILVGLPIFLSAAVWNKCRQWWKRTKPAELQYLSARDMDLNGAILTAARVSAYGRWFAAQHLVLQGGPIEPRYLIQVMAGQVMDSMLNGEIEVCGRKPGQMDYEAIPRTHWRSSTFFVIEDKFTLWRVALAPRGGAEISRDGEIVRSDHAPSTERNAQLRDYDSLIVDAYQFERVFPRNDPLADKKRREFLGQARKRGLDKDEIGRLSKERR